MRALSFGPTGREIPVIGYGTWQLEQDDRGAAIAAIRRAVELGATHIDTAELYGRGRVEEMLAEALGGGLRERVFLASKVLPENASFDGTIAACERSLRRLATDRLDLYMLHWRGRHPLDETFRAFERLRAAGKVLAWGVSNFDTDDLDEALAVAGEGRIACNQVLYHLKNRTIEHGVLPWCESHRVALVAYSPFGCGDFPSADSAGGRVLAAIAGERGVTSHAVALAFLCRNEAVFSIPKSSDAERVAANCAAGELALTADEIARIEKAFPLGNWRGLPSL
ncbi:MAG TPA: aldo/keto reductase [Kofleriaceae bacterium]|jgi:diketogulonate reductase-like aldo/keto reductase